MQAKSTNIKIHVIIFIERFNHGETGKSKKNTID